MSENKESSPGKKAFNLSGYRELWAQYKEHKKTQRQAKKWTDEFGDALKKLAGEADTFSLDGQIVAKRVAGQLNKTMLAKEQPQIIEKYTRTFTVERFDEAAFKEELPEIYKQYQADRLLLTEENE